MKTDKDYYKILGVAPKADADAIKKAYRRLAKRYHPDANPGDPRASDRFKDVGEANAVLSDPKKRAKYDQMRKLGAFGFGGARARPRQPGRQQAGRQQTTSFSFEDLGVGGFSDIFSSLFDRAAGKKADGRKPSGPAKGENVELAVEVPFMVAATGGKVSISVPISEECATCKGSGGAPGTSWNKCGECRGTGRVSFGQGGFAVSRPCPACVGRGEVAGERCGSCGGDGKVDQDRKIEVGVPAGTDSGSKARLAGQGERGRTGGAPGDLVVTFKVLPHRFFRREGGDIHVTVPINLAQAVLGSKIRVSTIWGKKVVLRVPAGTQGGTRFRVRGQGIARDGRRGDQYVEVRVEVPEEADLSDEQREQMRGFAESAGMKW